MLVLLNISIVLQDVVSEKQFNVAHYGENAFFSFFEKPPSTVLPPLRSVCDRVRWASKEDRLCVSSFTVTSVTLSYCLLFPAVFHWVIHDRW